MPKELRMPIMATAPRRFGPNNIPIAEVLIDDEDTPEREKTAHKPKLVILGTGWAVKFFSIET
jgi:NADH dehydrogenase